MRRNRLTAVLAAAAIMITGCASGRNAATETTVAAQTAEATGAETTAQTETEAAPTTSHETEPVETAPPEPETDPVSYAAFGIDKAEKVAFREAMSAKHDLPVINITTKNAEEVVLISEYIPCVVDVFNCGQSFVIDEAAAGIKVRGNSSAYYGDVDQIRKNQVPYRIKFDKKTNMLGLNDGAKCKSWVLLKADWDLIRNDIALRFGRAIMEPDGYYCSDATHVLVYVNDRFKGIYTLCEQCEVEKNRVAINEPKAGYIGTDTGYYLEIDNYALSEKDPCYITLDYGYHEGTDIRGTTREFVSAEYSIKSKIFSQEQVDFIQKYMSNLFEIVYLACERGEYMTFDENYDLVPADFTGAQQTVEAVMDIGSVVDMYLLYEIVHDYDCGEGSFFMCIDFSKDSNYPKLSFTSPWDFNWAYNDSAKKYWAGAFTESSFVEQYGDRSNPWFIVLIKQDWFAQLVSEKWTALKSENAIENCISQEKEILEDYRDDLCINEEWAVDSAYKLLEWIEMRINWMDDTFLKESD